jgi:hypothetical protein
MAAWERYPVPPDWDATGYLWEGPTLYFDVEGDPIGQGALTPVRIKPKGGKERLGNRHSNEKTLKPWRKAVQEAAERAARRLRWTPVPEGAPIRLDTVFTLPYGPTARRQGRRYPTVGSATNSDLDHYIRAAADAVSLATLAEETGEDTADGLRAVWGDDIQIVEHRAVKCYPGMHPLALPVPGARIWVRTPLDP